MRPSSAKARSHGCSRPAWMTSVRSGPLSRAAIHHTTNAAPARSVATRTTIPTVRRVRRFAPGSALTGPESSLGGADVRRARTPGAGLDVELDALASDQPVEVDGRAHAVAMEEVILAVLGGDEAEAAVGHDFLDTATGHGWPPTTNRKRTLFRRVASGAWPAFRSARRSACVPDS